VTALFDISVAQAATRMATRQLVVSQAPDAPM
jgi:hypothetical protein